MRTALVAGRVRDEPPAPTAPLTIQLWTNQTNARTIERKFEDGSEAMSLAMPNAIGSGPHHTERRASSARRSDLRRSGRPALFDRSEAVGVRPRVRKGTTVGEDWAEAAIGVGADGTGGGVVGGASGPRTSGPETRTSDTGGRPRRSVPAAPVPPAARALLADASLGLSRACASGDPADRYAIAHLAALRGAAAVLAARARPTRGQRGSVWALITRVAPEFAEWASFFAAGSAKRQAVQAGLPAGVTAREADDLVRQVALFLSLVGEGIGAGFAAGRR